jgi:hypothetical protein
MGIKETTKEYVVGTSITCQAIWMQRILKDLMHNQEEPNTIYCDNKSTIALSKNHVFTRGQIILTRDITLFENLSTMENSSYNIADQRSNLQTYLQRL